MPMKNVRLGEDHRKSCEAADRSGPMNDFVVQKHKERRKNQDDNTAFNHRNLRKV